MKKMFTENFKHMQKRLNSIMNSASDPVMVAVNWPQEYVDSVHLGDRTNPGCNYSALLPRDTQLDSAVRCDQPPRAPHCPCWGQGACGRIPWRWDIPHSTLLALSGRVGCPYASWNKSPFPQHFIIDSAESFFRRFYPTVSPTPPGIILAPQIHCVFDYVLYRICTLYTIG